MLITSKTDDNGEKLDITLRPDGAGYVRTVNGRVDKFDASTKVLAMWNQDALETKPGLFVSVIEDEVLKLAFTFVGKETMIDRGPRDRGRPLPDDRHARSATSGTTPPARSRGSGSSAAATRSSTSATSILRGRWMAASPGTERRPPPDR